MKNSTTLEKRLMRISPRRRSRVLNWLYFNGFGPLVGDMRNIKMRIDCRKKITELSDAQN